MKPTMKIEEVASLLKKRKQLIREWIKRGKVNWGIPTNTTGRRFQYTIITPLFVDWLGGEENAKKIGMA